MQLIPLFIGLVARYRFFLKQRGWKPGQAGWTSASDFSTSQNWVSALHEAGMAGGRREGSTNHPHQGLHWQTSSRHSHESLVESCVTFTLPDHCCVISISFLFPQCLYSSFKELKVLSIFAALNLQIMNYIKVKHAQWSKALWMRNIYCSTSLTDCMLCILPAK